MIRLFFAILTPCVILAQQRYHNSLPSTSECGTLREDQLYNLEKTVEGNEFPWIARLLNASNNIICISVLISKQYLLAPGYCADGGQLTTVELGNCRKNQNCRVPHELHLFAQHPKYNEDFLEIYHSIALVRMKNPVTFTEYIQPICLPSAYEGSINYVAQYHILTGQQLVGGRNGKVVVLIVDFKHCQKIHNLIITDNLFCANSCDNGSNYIAGSILMGVSVKNLQPDHYYLLGILLSKNNACSDSTPDIFTRIDRHVDWIVNSIAVLEGA